MDRPVDADVAPAPPSYTAEATATPWVSHGLLPPDFEVAGGIALDSPYIMSSPHAQAEEMLEAPIDNEPSVVHDSGAPSDWIDICSIPNLLS